MVRDATSSVFYCLSLRRGKKYFALIIHIYIYIYIYTHTHTVATPLVVDGQYFVTSASTEKYLSSTYTGSSVTDMGTQFWNQWAYFGIYKLVSISRIQHP
jgi:hypothetical protein